MKIRLVPDVTSCRQSVHQHIILGQYSSPWCFAMCVSGVDGLEQPANGSLGWSTLSKAPTNASRASPRTDRSERQFSNNKLLANQFYSSGLAWLGLAWLGQRPTWRSHIWYPIWHFMPRRELYGTATDFYWMGNFMRSEIMIIQQSIIYLNSQSHWVALRRSQGGPNIKWHRVCPFDLLWPIFFHFFFIFATGFAAIATHSFLLPLNETGDWGWIKAKQKGTHGHQNQLAIIDVDDILYRFMSHHQRAIQYKLMNRMGKKRETQNKNKNIVMSLFGYEIWIERKEVTLYDHSGYFGGL